MTKVHGLGRRASSRVEEERLARLKRVQNELNVSADIRSKKKEKKQKHNQGSKNLFSNTCQGGSKRKVLVAKVAV